MNVDSMAAWLKGGIKNKWRLAFLVFAVAYGTFLLFNLSYMSIQWDEVTHLNGGMLLLRGDYSTYFSFIFYPPMYDLFTAGFYAVGGISVFTGRLVTVAFSLLSLWAVFEFASRMYDAKTALLGVVLLALMPGYVWLSRMAMIETMLVFFFTVSTLSFFGWLRLHQNKFLIISGVMLGLGILVKYQTVIVGAIMLTALVVLGRGYLKQKLTRFPLLILTVVAVVIPWILVSYQIYASGLLDTWLYAISMGNPEKSLYSTGLNRFPAPFTALPSWLQTPVFYLFEMTVPYSDVHPVSFFLYLLGLAGLGWFALRRKASDKYLLIWFVVVYIFFTVIPNKQWRYVVPAFPVLALAAASLITSAWSKAQTRWQNKQLPINKRRLAQVAAVGLIAFTLVGAAFSVSDAYSWVAKDQIHIPIEEATHYAAPRLEPDESIMVLCAQNLYSQDMIRFYLNAQGKTNTVLQYPALPVDTYRPDFNVTELISQCQHNNVKYVLMYEFGGDVPYFDTDLRLMDVYMMLAESGRFGNIPTLEEDGTVTGTYFGTSPRQIYILTFLG